jgi:serine/threonine-protein kinase RsbW
MAITLHVSADAQPESIRPLRNIVASVARAWGLPKKQVDALKFCVSEAIANAVKHAYPESDPGSVEVTVREVGDELAVVVADHGQVNQRKPSADHTGFGLAFIERMMDGCTFTAASDGTTVEMLFPLPRAKATAASSEVERSRRRGSV